MDAAPARSLRPLFLAAILALAFVVALTATTGAANAASSQARAKHHKLRKKAKHRKVVKRHAPARHGAAETSTPQAGEQPTGIGNNKATESQAGPAPVDNRKPSTPSTPTPTPTSPTTPTTTPEAPAATPPSTGTGTTTGAMTMAPSVMSSGFEEGLNGWNTAGVGEVIPTTVSGNVRSGNSAARVVLTGTQNRSELGFGGDGTGAPTGKDFYEGDEYWYGFSFYIGQMVWGHPGSQNLIMQFKSEGEGGPNFGLQLWDWSGERGNGGRGLWSEGESMKVNGEEHRFLAPITEHAWHEIQIHFKASSVGNGFYELFLDGRLIETRTGVSMILPGKHSAYIKDGLYRYGPVCSGTSELLLDDASLGTSQASVTPA